MTMSLMSRCTSPEELASVLHERKKKNEEEETYVVKVTGVLSLY